MSIRGKNIEIFQNKTHPRRCCYRILSYCPVSQFVGPPQNENVLPLRVFYSAPENRRGELAFNLLCARFSSIVSYFSKHINSMFFFHLSSSNHLMIRDQCPDRLFQLTYVGIQESVEYIGSNSILTV